MINRFILPAFIFFIGLNSCMPSDEDVQIEIKKLRMLRIQEKIQDSIDTETHLKQTFGDNYKFLVDSINKAHKKESAKRDTEQLKILKNKYGKKVWKMHEKHPEWTLEDYKRANDGEYWIGMDYEMLVNRRGKPNSANVSNYGSGDNYQYCWYEYTPSCFYMGVNNIITSYN